ncbi:hypothetical protein AAAC51_08440 [Priestia megaterium]
MKNDEIALTNLVYKRKVKNGEKMEAFRKIKKRPVLGNRSLEKE